MTTPHKQNILIVEDDEAVRSVLRRCLERAGYGVREAGEGGAALKLLAAAPADLIITDLVMPDMEGIALIFSLRKSHPKLPVIAISGGGRMKPEVYLEVAKAGGAARILAKPFDVDILLGLVQEQIGLPPAATASAAPQEADPEI